MLKQQFERLSHSEQQRLIVALIIIVLLLAWLFIWTPISSNNTKLKTTLEQKAQLLEWMQVSAATVKASGNTNPQQQNSSALQPLINRQAQLDGLKINRLQTMSSGKIQLQLEQTDFNQLLVFLNHLSGKGAVLEQLSINRQGSAGAVSARLTFGTGQ